MGQRTRVGDRPKYLQIADGVRQQLHRGDLKPGDRLPSLSAAHEQLGIGRSTLERAHAVLEREGLIVREHGRGVFVTRARSRRLGSIGFYLSTPRQAIGYPFWTHLIEGMHAAAGRAGTELLLIGPPADAIRWDKVDALIALKDDMREIKHLIPPRMPCVSLLNHTAGIDSVVADDYSGIHGAVHHLIGLGHRRIGFLKLRYSWEAPLRLAAYESALSEAGIEPQAEWIWELTGGDPLASVSFAEMGRHSMREWFLHGFRETKCTALLAQNDETAIGIIDVLRDSGLLVPEDVSIIGFDGTEAAQYCSPPLATIVVPLAEMGQKAVELSREAMEAGSERPGARTITVPTRLRPGATTMPCRIGIEQDLVVPNVPGEEL